METEKDNQPDLVDVKGQESAKRVLEVAAAGGHNLLMVGAPGSGKSMLAARLPSILPPLTPEEMLEVSMVHSLAGELMGGKIATQRPFRAPHHSASMAALVGGGSKPRPGEVSLAHLGVLFLDELPEFLPNVLDALRQPLEAGETVIARANHRIAYPSRIQLVAAMNPCKCGGSTPGQSCRRGPRCADDYQARISGPLLDRIDLQIEVPAVSAADLVLPAPTEGSAEVRARVTAARERQRARFAALGAKGVRTNADCSGRLLEEVAMPDEAGVAAAAPGLRGACALRPRLPPHPARRPHAGRSRRRGQGRPRPRRRGAQLPRRDAPPAARGVRRRIDQAATVFLDALALTVYDPTSSQEEDRSFTLGCDAGGMLLAVAHTYEETEPGRARIRIISAREATRHERRNYEEEPH